MSSCALMWAVAPVLAAYLHALPPGSRVVIPASEVQKRGYTGKQVQAATRCCAQRGVICLVDGTR